MKNSPDIPFLYALVVDDHWMVRNGLRHLLKTQKGRYHFKISDAENGTQALEKVSKKDFDFVLLDYQLPDMDGAVVAEQIHAINPCTKILALSIYNEFSNVEKIMAAGAHGYILKNIGANELLAAIQVILKGQSYFSNEVYAKLHEARRINWQNVTLSSRELEVLQLLAQGKTSSQIATQLSLGKSTIDSHRSHLRAKFNVRNTVSLLKAASDRGLLP
jgi:two-component system nitrate/nitrite response regulator NarL